MLKLKDLRRLRKIEAWDAYFSGRYRGKEMEEIIMAEPAIKKALEYENYFTQDDALRRKYEMRQDGMREWITSINAAERRGEQKGIQKGEQNRSMQMAAAMLKDSMAVELIAKYSGLTANEILALQQKLHIK